MEYARANVVEAQRGGIKWGCGKGGGCGRGGGWGKSDVGEGVEVRAGEAGRLQQVADLAGHGLSHAHSEDLVTRLGMQGCLAR